MNYNWYYIERYNCCKKINAITCITSAVIQLKFFFHKNSTLTKSKVHFVFYRVCVILFYFFFFHSKCFCDTTVSFSQLYKTGPSGQPRRPQRRTGAGCLGMTFKILQIRQSGRIYFFKTNFNLLPKTKTSIQRYSFLENILNNSLFAKNSISNNF